MNRLRNRLILVFVAATILPLGLTLWTTLSLLNLSLELAPFRELDAVSKALETTGRELYNLSKEALAREAAEGRAAAKHLKPSEAQAFWDSGAAEQFELAGEQNNRLDYLVRHGGEVWLYSRPMPVAMGDLTREIANARQVLDKSSVRDLRRGFGEPLLLVASALWLAALAALIYLAVR